jgi:hypothetical protein
MSLTRSDRTRIIGYHALVALTKVQLRALTATRAINFSNGVLNAWSLTTRALA